MAMGLPGIAGAGKMSTKTAIETGAGEKLSVAEAVATMCLFSTDDQTSLKRDLQAGEYEIDMTMRIFGSLAKEASKFGIIAQRAAPWKLFAAAMQMLNGVSISKLVREAENITAQEEKDLKAQVQEALVAIKGTVEGVISGRTLPNLQWEKVSE